MHPIINLALKDLLLIRRDKVGMFFIVGFPIAMGVFFGMLAGATSPESAQLTIAVADEDDSDMSRKFVKSLDDIETVTVTPMTREAAMDEVRRGKLAGMIAIPPGFGETAGMFWEEGVPIEVGIDPARKAEAGLIEGMIMQSAGSLMTARFQDPATIRRSLEQAQSQLAENAGVPETLRPLLSNMIQAWESVIVSTEALQETSDEAADRGMPSMQLVQIEQIDVTRTPEKGSVEETVSKLRSPWDISFPQAMLWGVLACASGFAVTVVREQRLGTMARLEAAPISLPQILAGKGLACFIAVVGVIVMMMVIGSFLGVSPRSPGLLILAAFSTACCFVGIMMLMATIGKSEEAVGGASWGANVMMAMFGGGMVPLAFMPPVMKTLSDLSPVKWAILSLEGAIWRGFTFGEMLLPCGILLLIGAAGLGLGTVLLTRRVKG